MYRIDCAVSMKMRTKLSVSNFKIYHVYGTCVSVIVADKTKLTVHISRLVINCFSYGSIIMKPLPVSTPLVLGIL